MKHTRKSLLAFLFILSLFSLGFRECSKEEKQSVKHQAETQIDRFANSVKLAQGVVEDLYAHGKITKEQARDATEKLRSANTLGKRLGERIKAIDPNASALPSDLNAALD